MRTTDFKDIILKMLGNREYYGYEINKRLAAEGFNVEIGRLYKILREMSKESLLDGRWVTSEIGPRRRVYRLGLKGKSELDRILLDAIVTVHSFYGMYLMSLAPKINIIEDMISPLTSGLKGNENIAVLFAKHSSLNEIIIQYLHQRVPQGKILLVRPKSVPAESGLDNVLLIGDSYEDIPLKDDYVSAMLVIDLPDVDVLKRALREWARVMNRTGKLAILTPTILVSKHEDPMSIGDFVEKHEHEGVESGVHIDKEHLRTLLRGLFNVVHERDIAHMTTFTASGKK